VIVALGGALGGLLNGVVTPAPFDRVWEYPGALVASLVLGVGVFLMPSAIARRYDSPRGGPVEALLFLAAGVGLMVLAALNLGSVWTVGLGCLTLAAAWYAVTRALPLVGVMLALVACAALFQGAGALETVGTFYGAYQVSSTGSEHKLSHGNKTHGTQLLADPLEPTAYYSRGGPLGQAFGAMKPSRVGVVGLGAGTIAAYGRAGGLLHVLRDRPGDRRLGA
jgi:hypothetical protein